MEELEKLEELEIHKILETQQEYSLRITHDLEISQLKKVLKDSVRYIVVRETTDSIGEAVPPHLHAYVVYPIDVRSKTVRARIKETPWYKSLPKEKRGNKSYSLKCIPDGMHKSTIGFLAYIHKESSNGFNYLSNYLKTDEFTDELQQQYNKLFWATQKALKEKKKQNTIDKNTSKQFLQFVEDKHTIQVLEPTGNHVSKYLHPHEKQLISDCAEFLDSINSTYIADTTFIRLINYIEFKKNRQNYINKLFIRIESKI
eukprot:COSAG01_NODE_11630_length_1892_cov_7.590630_1_plen_258_part_00